MEHDATAYAPYELINRLLVSCSIKSLPFMQEINNRSRVLDNARYQKCQSVLEKAKELGIELLYLPT